MAKYPPTETSTERSRTEQNTEVCSISRQSNPNGLCTQTVKTSKSYTKYEINCSEQDCSEHGYDDTEQETNDDASIIRQQSSLSVGSTGSKTANWSMFNSAQFDDRNENDSLGENPQRSQRGRIVLPPLVVNKQMLNNKRKMNKAYTEELSESEDDDDNWTVVELKHSQSEPVIPQKQLTAVGTRTHDETDTGMKRIKSEVLVSKEYFSHEKIASKGDSPEKKTGLILSVKRRMSLKKKRPKQKHGNEDDEVTVINIIHESKSEPVIFKSTSV